MSGVWVFAEQKACELRKASVELLCTGRTIATHLNKELSAVILGSKIDCLPWDFGQYGIDKVYLVEHALLERYNPDLYVTALADLIKQYSPSLVLLGATSVGREVAPRIAGRIRAGIVTECVNLRIAKDGRLTVTKPIYGGELFATFVYSFTNICVMIFSSGTTEISKSAECKQTEVIRVSPALGSEAIRTEFLSFIEADPRSVDLTEANVIVAAGRGIGNAEGLKFIQDLADQLGGSIGGSRPVVDAGWLPSDRHIGMTGKRVSPDLYIACGISGQYQHVVGMKDSSAVIAINTDRNAPIFKVADLGIVGDFRKVVPAIIRQLGNRREKGNEGDSLHKTSS